MPGIEEIAARAKAVPLLSQSVLHLLDLMDDPEHSVQDVRRVVETDAGLTAHVLKVVNSASFELRYPVDTLDRAVSLLGDKAIMGIALATSSSHLYDRPLAGYESERGQMWEHSLKTAIAARETARFALEETDAGLAYTGGLLHDLGKSIISEFLQGTAASLVAQIDGQKTTDYLAAERSVLGTDHCAVGAALAKHWGLPPMLGASMRYHHAPADAEAPRRSLAYVVHLADMIAMMGGVGTGADSLLYGLDERYATYVDLSPGDLERLMFKVSLEFEKTKASVFGSE